MPTAMHAPLSPQADERWALLGRNASGKTTMLQRMAFASRDQAAVLPQHHFDAFALPVQAWLRLHGDALDADLLALAHQLDIADLLHRPITQLSGGERQRVGLAAVAMQKRPLWLLDEPISAQDPVHQRLVGRWLRTQITTAVVFAAHDVPWVMQTATHVHALLPNGQVLQGTAAEVLTSASLSRIYGISDIFAASWGA